MSRPGMEVLFERPGLPAYGLPPGLRDRYGGDLGFSSPRVVANFVSSLDGVVTLGDAPPAAISGGSGADRFVMGLLRACADAVLIGAGTLRAEPDHHWTPEYICPSAEGEFAVLRKQLGRSEKPLLVVLTARGDVPADAPALEEGAIVATTAMGAGALRGRLPTACTVVALSEGDGVDPAAVLDMLSQQGRQVVLTEGGPTLMGAMLRGRLLDELFLTLAPVIAGRNERGKPSKERLGLVEGVEFTADGLPATSLMSVRGHCHHLYLRYALE